MPKINNPWKSIVGIGTGDLNPYGAALGVTKGINLLSLFIFTINIVFGPAYYFATGKLYILIGSLSEAGFVAGLVLLNHFKRRNAANITFYLVLNAATFYFSAILGQLGEAQLMIVFLVGLAMFMFQKSSTRFICIVGSILLLVLMEANFKLRIIDSIRAGQHSTDLMRWTAYAVIIFLVTMLFYLYARDKSRLLIELQKHSERVEIKLREERTKNGIKTQLFQNASHELKTQFAGVLMIVNILSKLDKGQLTNQFEDVTKNLKASCHTLEFVLMNVLEYSKLEAGVIPLARPEPMNLIMTLESIVDVYQYAAYERNLSVVFESSPEVPEYLVSDKLKSIQIVTNLLHNAIKFAKPYTTVHLSLEKQKNNWKLTVKNEGQGIPPEKLEKIFEPFVTEENIHNEGGVGLGLSLTKQLVISLGGEITAVSELGESATFIVLLPVIDTSMYQRKSWEKYTESLG